MLRRALLSFAGLGVLALVGSRLVACGGGGAAPQDRPGVPPDQAKSLALSALPFAELELPPNTRPDHAAPPDALPLMGPWKYAGASKGGLHKWTMDVPIRPRSLFFHSPQPGMKVTDASGATLDYDRGAEDHPSWSYNRQKLTLVLPDKAKGPDPGAYHFVYDRAVERERRLNLELSGIDDPAEFAWASIFDDWDSRDGLLLPAPGKAAWDVEVPAAGELLMHPGIAEPEILDAKVSDGARLVVEVDTPEGPRELWSGELKVAEFEPVRVDLSAFAGQKVRLRLRSEPIGDDRYDYVFIGQPVVASRASDPRRVVLVFVDTLRPDHMSLYGYEQKSGRKTTEKLDAWAKDAVVFEQARSVAPWTLPSARTVVTGRHPEYYDGAWTLQERLAEQGFATAMFAGNVYLSSNFDMHRDWGLHRVGLFPSATEVTDDALAFLDAHEGRDVLMQVHYMDAHLPYHEPASHRMLYAGDPQGGLGERFELGDVRARITRQKFDPKAAKYVVDRYDNNVRYATDEIDRLLQRLDENDIVVFFADHGEEFWDHGGFEHGHTLFDELLHVPLVVKAPGLAGRRVDVPVSLLDVTPTVLDALGLPFEGTDGTSLLRVAKGDEAAVTELRERDLAFGRPLYGTERWGVLTDNKKWTTNEGREALYDLAADPEEETNLIANMVGSAGAPYHPAFEEALGVPVAVGYRLFTTTARGKPEHDLVATMTVPGGIEKVWVANDPLMHSSAVVQFDEADPEHFTATWHAGYAGSRDVYVIPKLPIEEVTHGLVVETDYGGDEGEIRVNPQKDPGLGRHRTPLGRVTFEQPTRALGLTFVITPMFDEDAKDIVANDPEVRDMLEEMGYAVGDPTEKGKDPKTPGAAQGLVPQKED